MAAKPDAQLLANGDILIPADDGGGGWRMLRVTLDDAEYAEWLRVIQQRDRQPSLLAKGVAFWLSAALLMVCFWALVIVVALVTHVFR